MNLFIWKNLISNASFNWCLPQDSYIHWAATRVRGSTDDQWLNYSTKDGGSLFPGEKATRLEICIRMCQYRELLRVHTHNTSFFKVAYDITKASDRKITNP